MCLYLDSTRREKNQCNCLTAKNQNLNKLKRHFQVECWDSIFLFPWTKILHGHRLQWVKWLIDNHKRIMQSFFFSSCKAVSVKRSDFARLIRNANPINRHWPMRAWIMKVITLSLVINVGVCPDTMGAPVWSTHQYWSTPHPHGGIITGGAYNPPF